MSSPRTVDAPAARPPTPDLRHPTPIREIAEYVAAWSILKGLGLLPRRGALAAGRFIGRAAYRLGGGLRRTGRRNLELAFPDMPVAERERVLRGAFENLGRQLGEFSQFPKLKTPDDAYRTIAFENRELVMDAIATGRGVLFLTGHIGAWEMSPFHLRLSGSPPVNFLVRPIDNPRVERLADRYRTLHGNQPIDKRDAARPVLAALRRGEMVGILVDLNMLEGENVFVDFFGRQASTTMGLTIFALRTDAIVMPVYTYWREAERRYALRFEEPVDLVRTGSKDEDIHVNTARFTKVIEDIIRRHPDQWLWIHKRWKTRPPGEEGLYK